jgi:RNA polymerase primary sigma factor
VNPQAVDPVDTHELNDELDMSVNLQELPTSLQEIAPRKTKKIDPLFFEYAKTRNVKIRNELIKKNTPLVPYVIAKFYGPDYNREDLLQEGLIGLISAVEGFRPELGFQFSTYASWWIRQAINNYTLNVEPLIHVPSHVRLAKTKLSKKLEAENETISKLLSEYKNKDDNELFTEKMLRSITAAAVSKNILSIDEPCKNGETSIGELIPDEREPFDFVLFRNETMQNLVEAALQRLSVKERLVLLLRFSIIDNPEQMKELFEQNEKTERTP